MLIISSRPSSLPDHLLLVVRNSYFHVVAAEDCCSALLWQWLCHLDCIYAQLKKKLSSAEALKLLNWMPLSSRRFAHRVKLVQNAIKGEIPQHLNCFKQIANHRWELRNNYLPRLVRPRTEWRRRATYYKAITDWNSLPKSLRTLIFLIPDYLNI